MGRNPRTAPSIRRSPGVGVQMKRPEIKRGDLQVGLEVDALAIAEGIASVGPRREPEPFVAQRDHVLGVERLHVGRRLARPLGHDRRRAPIATRLVGELPGEDRG